MGAHKNVITLNGQLYDATTGRMVGEASAKKTAVRPHTGVSVDGVRRAHPTKPAHAIHKTPQPAKTLMRSAVKKPKMHVAQHSLPSRSTAQPIPRISQGASLEAERLKRAAEIAKSKLVQRFDFSPPPSIKARHTQVEVKPAPHISQHHVSPVVPVAEPPIPAPSPSESVIQKALANASSHQQPKVKAHKVKRSHRIAKKLHIKPKTLHAFGTALIVLSIVGVIGYANAGAIQVKIAATRAGVAAKTPGYEPAGFGLSSAISPQPGEVTIDYKSNSDDRAFKVSQSNSSWNSETLLQNFINAQNRTYQTFQNNGKTIFVYDNGNATWVDGGVWYKIEGNSSLNSDQLLRLAGSL